MSDWHSPEELQADALAFDKLIHAMLGVYTFEWLISLDFDWKIITGRKRFRWPLTFYFLNRYFTVFTFIGIIIAQDNKKIPLNCTALWVFNQLAGNATVGFASINLSIRTMAVWSQNVYVKGFLVLVILGHWSLILQGTFIKATWIPDTGCAITSTKNKLFAAVFIYSMCFDFSVLSLTAYKLVGGNSHVGGGRLARMIFKDGLIYFILAFLVNLMAVVFLLLDLNQILGVIMIVPSGVVSTIAATRVVRRLNNFEHRPAEIFDKSSSQPSSLVFNHSSGNQRHTALEPSTGVHVQMDTSKQEDNTGVSGIEPKLV